MANPFRYPLSSPIPLYHKSAEKTSSLPKFCVTYFSVKDNKETCWHCFLREFKDKKIQKIWKENETTRCYYKYAWSHNELGEPKDTFMYDKIHTKDYHWIYPIHEVLSRKDASFKEVSIVSDDKIYLHHWQDLSKKRGYYFDLLKLSRDENPNDAHVQMLLAREYVLKGDNKTAIDEFLKLLKMPDVDKPNRRLVLIYGLIMLGLLYEAEKNFDEAIWYCQEAIKEDPTYREPYFILGEMYNLMKMYTLAESVIKAGFEYGTHKYNWVEMGKTWLTWGEDILSVAQTNLHKYDEALKNMDAVLKHNPNDVRVIKNQNIILKKMVELLKKE